MAEEVKKAPKPVDVNSAKCKLGKIAADAYVDAIEAKKRGEKVAWVSSNFPVEIPETMGIATVYPENQAAGIAARGAGTRMCEVAESEGYSNDICAYARVSLAYAKLKSCPEQDVAMPDVLLCCSNICSCMIKWYENLARELNIPMILLDIPFNPDYEVSDAEVAYVTGQFWTPSISWRRSPARSGPMRSSRKSPASAAAPAAPGLRPPAAPSTCPPPSTASTC